MEIDLHITDKQYLIALTVFFFPYALFEVCNTPFFSVSCEFYPFPKPVSNVILKRLRPSIWLSSMMLFWGIIMVFLATAAGYTNLKTCFLEDITWCNS